jgi:hypothetical protein
MIVGLPFRESGTGQRVKSKKDKAVEENHEIQWWENTTLGAAAFRGRLLLRHERRGASARR